MRPYLHCLIAAIALALGCTNKRTAISTPTEPDDPRWAPIDSLAAIGQYFSALTMTGPLLAEARAKGDWQQEFRAMMTTARFQQETGAEDSTIIRIFEERAKWATFPLNALLHSVIGEQYWNWYRDNRWEIMERTALAEGTGDLTTWTQPQFMEKVIAEYRASLTDTDSLKIFPNARLGDLLVFNVPSDPLDFTQQKREALTTRPSLFDLLAHRALAVFRNSETRVAEPSSRFQLSDARYFSLFEDFAHMRITHADSTSWELQALKMYQELERAHLSGSKPDALVDNTLARLSFVRERSTLADKDSLYLNALITLASRLSNDTCLGEVIMAQARWHQEMSGKYQRLSEGLPTTPPWKWERKVALELSDTVLARYSGTHAGAQATMMKDVLLEAELTVQAEEAVLPDSPFKCAVDHRNVPKLWLRLVKDDLSTAEYLQNPGNSDDARLVERKALREWSIDLPDDGDLNGHRTEVAVEGLPFGQYVLILCDSSGFKAQVDHISYVRFWVTRLAVTQRWAQGEWEVLVMDRSTGAPKQGLAVAQWIRDYRQGNAFNRSPEPLTTGTDGFVRSRKPVASGSIAWESIDGADRYISAQTWIPDFHIGEQESTRIFLFTDRAIYRPGQPVLFKGIVTRKNGKKNETVPSFKTTVELYDVNGEKVDTLSVASDAYGSFHGTFTAPRGALTGSMTVRTPYGSLGIQVEEYKRPTFEVVFDPVAGQPKLGQEVLVTGLAKSYAGVPLDGAKVQWTVKRSAHMPWWCGWYYRGWLPWGRNTQVAQGEAVCDAQGGFAVRFTAEADDQFPRGAEPIFNFTVEAAVVDISGETQSGTTGLSLGYKSISIELDFGESLDRSKADSIDVHVANLNGQRVDVPMDIRVFKLQAPPTPLRDRAWERPDRYTLTREQHTAKFPQDVYAEEADPLTWTRGAELLRAEGVVPGGKRLPIREARSWDVGSYLIEVIAKDAHGEEVEVAKVFTVFDPDVQNTGFVSEAFHAELLQERVEPGTKAKLLLSSALPEGRVLMEVERGGKIAVSRWFTLKNTQQLVELPVLEDDRGGFTIHLLCVERGIAHSGSRFVTVPWTNKELKVEWLSFRDKLLPGSEEEWRLKITGSKGEKVAAQLLGAMYDASLDHFVPHNWDMTVWLNVHGQLGWQRQEPFGAAGGQQLWRERRYPGALSRNYPELNDFGYSYEFARRRFAFRGGRSDRMEMMMVGNAVAATAAPMDGDELQQKNGEDKEEGVSAPPPSEAGQPTTDNQQPLRSDFRETAFFFPDLLTDRDGSIVLRFKTPDALTRWKVMGLAHTKDLQLAQFSRGTVTQKPLMIVPNLPRFLRAGDRITLTAKINVIEQGRAEGLATLELFDPFTNASLNRSFGLQVKDHSFVAAIGESAVVEWSISVPEGVDACGVRITAQSKGGPLGGIVASDGEERALPVLTDKVLVTESVPLWSNTAGTKTFKLPNLLTAGNSTTLRHQSLKLEYTPNPAWYAVQALPYLMEFPHECAEQVFSRYYANRLATHIVDGRPAIRTVFEQWRLSTPLPGRGAGGEVEAFASKLEKNPELKNILLAETPWVVNARSERESKERIALLFDMARMAGEEATALKKLRDMQLPGGAWPWWSGMRESRWITQHIVAGLGHLEVLKATGRGDVRTQDMLQRAVQWLDQASVEDHARTTNRMTPEELKAHRPGYTELHYLYARSFFQRWPTDGQADNVARFYRERAAAHWLEYGLQEQAMIALALHRSGDRTVPALIMESLKQRATNSEELGMYWKDFASGMGWNSFPVETHALMIEAFDVIVKDEAAVNALRTYLLKLKQTTDWKTTKATAEACYALLLTGDNWLDDAAAPVITVGNETVKAVKQAAGTGAIEESWTAERIKPGMGNVTITSKADKPSWGALHWQYFESMDKVKAHENPFRIKKDVMLTRQTDQGPKLEPLFMTTKLKAGDKLTIRIELRTDRYVDHVHMKDLRASGLEPTETLSGYKYQGGLGYYQSIRDASINFFFDRIGPGTYVFEYTLRVTHAGQFSNGITTAMCMYAPEFASHSAGVRLNVNPD